MFVLGIAVAYTTSDYVGSWLNPSPFNYLGNTYKEATYELSTDMEQKSSATYLYDYSGHSPSRDLLVPDTLASTSGKYGRAYLWAFPRNLPMTGADTGILTESFTIEAWLNPQKSLAPDGITSWAGIADQASKRLLLTSDGFAWAQMTDPPLDFTSSVALGAGSWTHVAFVYDSDAGTVSWMINGTLDRTSESGYFSNWNGAFRVGGWTDAESYRWAGRIDEFRIKRAAITASQATDDMNRPIQKTLTLRNLAPVIDKAILDVTNGGVPQEVTADANGNAIFGTFEYGDQFDGYITVIHNDMVVKSASLQLHTGDEYRFALSFYLSPNYIFVIITLVFPLATAIVYFAKRRATRKATG